MHSPIPCPRSGIGFLMDLTNEQIRRALEYPYPAVVQFALSLVNLKDREMEVLRISDMEGRTDERTAEVLDVSVRTIGNLKSSAYNKIRIVWSNLPLIHHMITFKGSGTS